MSKVKAIPDIDIPDVGFNLEAQEKFASDKGVIFEHYAAMPSPIGKKNRGDYRRSDSLDTISEGGFLYKKIGDFVGTIISNKKSNDYKGFDGGIYDNSTAKIVIPLKYRSDNTKEISLLPGDRIYAKDTKLRVANYQEFNHNATGVDSLQFPILSVTSLADSNNNEYRQGVDFNIDSNGNIRWIDGKNSPGVDPDTGNGRVCSIRYDYSAFWYIRELSNEIRVTNTGDASKPARLPYHAVIQREYVYHSKNRGDAKDSNNKNTTPRTKKAPEPTLRTDPDFEVKVNIHNFDE